MNIQITKSKIIATVPSRPQHPQFTNQFVSIILHDCFQLKQTHGIGGVPVYWEQQLLQ